MDVSNPEKKSVPLFAVQDFMKNQNMFEAISLAKISQYTSRHAPTISSEYTTATYYSRAHTPMNTSPQAQLSAFRPSTKKKKRSRCRPGEEQTGVV